MGIHIPHDGNKRRRHRSSVARTPTKRFTVELRDQDCSDLRNPGSLGPELTKAVKLYDYDTKFEWMKMEEQEGEDPYYINGKPVKMHTPCGRNIKLVLPDSMKLEDFQPEAPRPTKGQIDEAMTKAAQEKGLNWSELRPQLKKAGRWHVETY